MLLLLACLPLATFNDCDSLTAETLLGHGTCSCQHVHRSVLLVMPIMHIPQLQR